MYIISRINYEYNDNWYEAKEGCGELIKAFKNKANANLECAKQNLIHYRNEDMSIYQYSLGYTLDFKQLTHYLPELKAYRSLSNYYQHNSQENLIDTILDLEDWEILALERECLKLKFFQVIEIEVDNG